jgi:hypothetical protein
MWVVLMRKPVCISASGVLMHSPEGYLVLFPGLDRLEWVSGCMAKAQQAVSDAVLQQST